MKAALDDLFRNGGVALTALGLIAAMQAAFELGLGRRQNQDADRLRQILLHLCGALHVDIEQQVIAARLGLAQESFCGAVVISKDVGVLEELIFGDHAFEFVARDEIIFAAILLTAAGRPRGVGDGEVEVVDDLADLIDQGRLSRTRRRRDDEDERFHSTFCTCSRDFSISDFMASPNSVMRSPSPLTPAVFESSVLASRFISCSRKSSFLPTSPFSSSRPRKCWM